MPAESCPEVCTTISTRRKPSSSSLSGGIGPTSIAWRIRRSKKSTERHPDVSKRRIIEFGQAIADCGVRHRAALLLSLYEPPAVLGDELAHLASQAPTAIEGAMLELLREGRASGTIRPGIDLALLSDRLCQSMLHVGVGVSHMTPGEEQVPEVRLRILLGGSRGGHPRMRNSTGRMPSRQSRRSLWAGRRN